MCNENASLDFYKIVVASATWDKDELIKFWGQKVKGRDVRILTLLLVYYVCFFSSSYSSDHHLFYLYCICTTRSSHSSHMSAENGACHL